MAVSSPQYFEKYILFLQFFAGGLHDFGGVIGCFLGISRNKASTVFYDTANWFALGRVYAMPSFSNDWSGLEGTFSAVQKTKIAICKNMFILYLREQALGAVPK